MKLSFKKINKIIIMSLIFLSSCNGESSIVSSTSSSLYGEQYVNFVTPDLLTSIDIPYFEDDEYVINFGYTSYPRLFTNKYIHYANQENVNKAKEIFKKKGEYRNTKDIKLYYSNMEGYSTPFVVYHDNYYFVLKFSGRDTNETTITSVSLSSLFYTADIQYDRNRYTKLGAPFPYLIDSSVKLDLSEESKEYTFTYEDLNSNCILADYNFTDYESIKNYYLTVPSEYIEAFDDENKKITLKTYDFDNKDWGVHYFYIQCNDTNITLTIDLSFI